LSGFWWLGHHGRFDLVHIHGCTHLTTLIWIVLGWAWGKPTVFKITTNGVDNWSTLTRYPILGPVASVILPLCDGFVAISDAIADDLAPHVPAEKIFRVSNGYMPERFFPIDQAEKAD